MENHWAECYKTWLTVSTDDKVINKDPTPSVHHPPCLVASSVFVSIKIDPHDIFSAHCCCWMSLNWTLVMNRLLLFSLFWSLFWRKIMNWDRSIHPPNTSKFQIIIAILFCSQLRVANLWLVKRYQSVINKVRRTKTHPHGHSFCLALYKKKTERHERNIVFNLYYKQLIFVESFFLFQSFFLSIFGKRRRLNIDKKKWPKEKKRFNQNLVFIVKN